MLRRVVTSLATLDCLASLAVVAKQEGYTKPIISTDHEVRYPGNASYDRVILYLTHNRYTDYNRSWTTSDYRKLTP